jgi:uncharacterized cupin superfamily protein
MKHPHIIHLADVPVDKIKARENSRFGGERRRVGAHIGAEKLGYSFFTVPPGKVAFPFHSHTGNEEMIYIIGGSGTLRFGAEDLPVKSATVIACPPGSQCPHQLINTGLDELRYLVVSTMVYPDLTEYPDSNKVGALGGAAVGSKSGFRAFFVKDTNVDYYDGEDGEAIERILKSSRRGA